MKVKALNTMDIRRQNKINVMLNMIKTIETTRNDLKEDTNYSYSTIGNILNDLLDEGYIYESKHAPSTGGRKSQIIALNYNKYLFISIDLAFYNFHWAIHDLVGNIIHDEYCKYNHKISILDNYRTLRDLIHKKCNEKIEFSNICYMGISVPYYYDREKHVVNDEFEDELQKVNLEEIFKEKFNIPVLIDNDANMAAYCEITNNDYSNDKCMFYFFISENGVGSTIITDNQIFPGAKGFAGECYVIPIIYKEKVTTLENLLRPNKDMEYISKKIGKKVNEEMFFKLYKEKNEYAIEIYDKIVFSLSYACKQIIFLLNPSHILISGFYNRYGDVLIDDIKKRIKEVVFPWFMEGLNINYSHHCDKAILMGLYQTMKNEWVYTI